MPLSPRLSLFVSLCLVADALAEIPQVPYAAPNYLVPGAQDQIVLEAPYAVSNYATLDSFSWPSAFTWATLNSTLGGRLQALRPWAAVCYTEDPLYDPGKCKTVLSNYTNEYTRDSIASALLWTNWESCGYDNGCALNYSDPQPVSGKPCHQGSTPPYGTAISSAQDASDIVKWAAAHNVKLTIKNTGHDYLGRSSGPSSLQVFTHHLSSVTYVADFVPQGSSDAPVPALIIGAGTQLEAIFSVLEAHNVSAVFGSCLTVGAGGFIQGGGVSILTPAYGLAVDYLLEVEIVTADGVIRTINAAQDPDLFWAIRGGGAGSWGIIISITVGTLPSMALSSSSLIIAPNASQGPQTLGVNFIALLSKYQNQIINSGITSTVVFVDGTYKLNFIWPVEKASLSQLYPLFDEIQSLSSNYTILSNVTHVYSTLTAAIVENASPSGDASSFFGDSTELASRFVPQSMLEDHQSIRSVAEAIWGGLEIATAPSKARPAGVFDHQVGVILYGDMAGAATKDRVNETGANPGCYGAAWHVVYTQSWTLGTSESTYASMVQSVHSAVGPLNALGLTASFQNEGNAWETNWQEAFFGYKYNRLQQIKQKYDPNNFFTTFKGVASATGSAVYSCYHQN